MPVAIPAARPQLTHAQMLAILEARRIDIARERLMTVWIRRYYDKTLGRPGNDRGIYDDASFIVTPTGMAGFNGNTDPSLYRKGRGFGGGKGVAVLKPGLYRAHRFDIHRAGTKGAHLALCQRAGPVTVTRDGDPPYEETSANLGINQHRGGINATNSLGCLTVPPVQWPEWIALATGEAKRLYGAAWNRTTVPLLLLDGV